MESGPAEAVDNPAAASAARRATRDSAAVGTLSAVALLAICNFAAGRLGLELAIPPGYATAVFPPAGIALAAILVAGSRVWPGVLLGSFALNLQLSLDAISEQGLARTVAVALSIAVGSTLQALFAAKLVGRHTHAPTQLTRELDVVGLLVLGGPVGCVVAASWGIATLYGNGVLVGDAVISSWFTWWVGDMLGVLIFAPLCLACVAQPRSLWRPRLLSVALPLSVAFTIVVLFYVLVSRHEEEAIAARFRSHVETLDRSFARSLNNQTELLWSIRSFFASSMDVNRDEFETFTSRSLMAFPGLLGLSWNPVVDSQERRAFEQRETRELGTPFVIRTRDQSGHLVPAPERDQYVVVRYIEPRAPNEAVIGFDVLSEPSRRRALEQARDMGEPAASERIALVQDADHRYGYLLFLPIYQSDLEPSTVEDRRAALQGFAVAVLRIDRVLETAFQGLSTHGVDYELIDESARGETRQLAHRRAGAEPAAGPDANRAGLGVTFEHRIGGRTWSIHYAPNRDYISDQPAWQAWAVLASGLTGTGLLGALLLVVTGRAFVEIDRRAEIAEINRRLELTNQELEGFAYAASHDLRSPLSAVSRLVEYIELDHGPQLPAEVREHLELIRSRIGRMARLLDELLEYSRAGPMDEKIQRIVIGDMVEGISEMLDRSAFPIECVDLQEIETAAVPLEQVLRNLCSNAINHHDRETGRIEVHCADAGDHYLFAVHDDGPGIAPEEQPRMFEMFRRGSRTSGVRGSGMGLALVRKIVTHRNGRVWIESDGQRGTTIHFTWPKTLPVGLGRA